MTIQEAYTRLIAMGCDRIRLTETFSPIGRNCFLTGDDYNCHRSTWEAVLDKVQGWIASDLSEPRDDYEECECRGRGCEVCDESGVEAA